MIGTRAPSTMPAASALARNVKVLGQHVAGLEIGHDQDLRSARDFGLDALDPRRFGIDGVVEGKRPVEDAAGDLSAVCHLAERSRLDRRRNLGGHGFDRGQNCHPRRAEADLREQIDRVLDDVALGIEIRERC